MRVNVDVYTQDIDAALEAFRCAIMEGATDVRLNTGEDWETKEFEYCNLMFEIDHTAAILTDLDDGPFVKDRDQFDE